jgi:hypothetical protein
VAFAGVGDHDQPESRVLVDVQARSETWLRAIDVHLQEGAVSITHVKVEELGIVAQHCRHQP